MSRRLRRVGYRAAPVSTATHIARRGALTAMVAIGLLVVVAPPAAAHVDLATSDPADGSVHNTPVDAVVLTFTESAQPAGNGIMIITEADEQVAAAVSQVDDTTIQITPVEPLTNGSFAIGWTVRAGDAHPRSGAITFTVTAPAPAPGGADDAGAAPAQEPDEAAMFEMDPPQALPEPFASLTEGPATTGADWLGRVARALGLAGALLGIGALLFAASVPLSSDREAASTGFWIRRGGLAVLVSLPLELVAQSTLLSGGSFVDGFAISSFATALGGPFGWAVLLRFLGGAGLLWGTDVATTTSSRSELHRSGLPHSPSAAATVTTTGARHRLDLVRSPLAVAGATALVVSSLFDGHTVTASPGWLVRFTDAAHVTAGATWAGGVVVLAATLAGRHRSGQPVRAGEMVLRFSSVASAALAVVGVAGIVLAWAILGSIGDLFGTPWGRVLIAKLLAVGAASAIGAYNHYVVIPRIGEDEEAASGLIRRTTRIEATVLLAVVALTAVLVGAAS